MKYKHIEAMRQIRLMLTDVVLPLGIAGAVVVSNEKARNTAKKVFIETPKKLYHKLKK